MLIALKITLLYMLIMVAMFIPMVGLGGLLFSHEIVYIIPLLLGNFILIFITHSPLFKYIESLQSKVGQPNDN